MDLLLKERLSAKALTAVLLDTHNKDCAQGSVSVLGFQYNFSTGSWAFSPSKSFSLRLQLGLGGEVTLNSATFNQQAAASDACRAQGGR
jgi:hypothetical protein